MIQNVLNALAQALIAPNVFHIEPHLHVTARLDTFKIFPLNVWLVIQDVSPAQLRAHHVLNVSFLEYRPLIVIVRQDIMIPPLFNVKLVESNVSHVQRQALIVLNVDREDYRHRHVVALVINMRIY